MVDSLPPLTSSSPPSLHARTLLFGASLVLAGGLAARGYMELTTDAKTHRVESILTALPQITTDKTPSVLFFGTSTASMGVSPTVFEQLAADAGISARFYNFGVPHSTPSGALLLGRRVREAFAAAGRRPALVLLEFDPIMTTTAHRHTVEGQARGEPGTCVLTRGREWVRDLVPAPVTTVKTAFYCQMFDQPTPFVGIDGPLQRLFAEEPAWWFGDHPRPVPRDRQLHNLFLRPVTTEFTMTNRGYQDPFKFGSVDDWKEYLTTRRAPDRLKRGVKVLNTEFDARDLHLDDRYVRDVMTAIKEWQAFGTNVYVVVPPIDPTYLGRSREGDARRAEVLVRIAETGAPILDTEKFTEDFRNGFLDNTHLDHLTGVIVYTRLIVQHVAGMLR